MKNEQKTNNRVKFIVELLRDPVVGKLERLVALNLTKEEIDSYQLKQIGTRHGWLNELTGPMMETVKRSKTGYLYFRPYEIHRTHQVNRGRVLKDRVDIREALVFNHYLMTSYSQEQPFNVADDEFMEYLENVYVLMMAQSMDDRIHNKDKEDEKVIRERFEGLAGIVTDILTESKLVYQPADTDFVEVYNAYRDRKERLDLLASYGCDGTGVITLLNDYAGR